MTIRRILKEFISTVYDRIVTFLFGLYFYENRKFRIPRPNNEILFDDVETLAKKIKSRQVSCFDVLSAYLDRLKTVNGLCNAAVDINEDRSRRDARYYDMLIEKNDPSVAERPLFGIPFTTKDSTAVTGMLHTLGLRARRNVRAEFDADFVKRLKKAGAICIAVTNLPELNLWQETRNLVFGNTLNPFDLNRTVGGSSGGEGCLVATNSTAFGMGTDIGGSIRGPSFFCGVFGHKTTVNAIQRRGTTLRESNETDTMVSVGPICRTARDIAPLLKVLSVSQELVSKLDLPVNIENLQCYYIKEIDHPLVRPVNDEMKANFQKVLNYFDEKCSKKPIELIIPELKHVNMLWRFWMSKERPAFETVLRKFDNFNLFWEIVSKLFGQSNYTLAALIKLIDNRMPLPDEKLAVELTNQIRNQLMDVLNNDNSILILPSYTSTAEYHYSPFLRPFDYVYWALFNIVKMPTTQIPTGLSKNNLPLGIQVVAAPFNDYLCIAIAKEIENNLPTFIPPYPTR